MNKSMKLLLPLVSIFVLLTLCSSEDETGFSQPARDSWLSLYDSLPPLLTESDGSSIHTADEWMKPRMELKRRWADILGTGPQNIPSLLADTLNTSDEDNYTRYHILLSTEENCSAEAYLLVPRGSGPFPAVVCFHSTSDNTINQPAGLADSGDQHFGKYCAERGYVAIMPKNFIYEYRSDEPLSQNEREQFEKKYPGRSWGIISDNTIRLLRRHPQWTGLGKMIWDGSRCIDYLQSLPQVKKENIGVIGHSLGGKEALFLPAFDSRIKAAVSSEGGIGLSFSNWFDPWYIGPKQSDMQGMDNHQVLSFIAPRPFLLIAGEGSDGDRSYAFIQHARQIYKLYGAEKRIALYNHKQGHKVTMNGVEKAMDWLDTYLK